MIRFALQPRWLPWHLLLVAVLVSFTWLGWWQLSAFEHKVGGGAASADRRTVALDTLSRPGGRLTDSDVGRPAEATGSYDPDGTRLVPGRARHGGSGSGFWVVSMLRTGDGVQPVVRGWVGADDDTASTTPTGEVSVTGQLQRSESAPTGARAGDVGPGQLPYVATVTVLDAMPYQPGELYDGYLALRSETPAPALALEPVEAQAAETGGVGRWRNLAYALQWWLFAGAAVFFWWLVLRREALEQQQPEPAPDEDRPPLVAPRRTT